MTSTPQILDVSAVARAVRRSKTDEVGAIIIEDVIANFKTRLNRICVLKVKEAELKADIEASIKIQQIEQLQSQIRSQHVQLNKCEHESRIARNDKFEIQDQLRDQQRLLMAFERGDEQRRLRLEVSRLRKDNDEWKETISTMVRLIETGRVSDALDLSKVYPFSKLSDVDNKVL